MYDNISLKEQGIGIFSHDIDRQHSTKQAILGTLDLQRMRKITSMPMSWTWSKCY